MGKLEIVGAKLDSLYDKPNVDKIGLKVLAKRVKGQTTHGRHKEQVSPWPGSSVIYKDQITERLNAAIAEYFPEVESGTVKIKPLKK